jgi:hypothetical protein
MQSNLKSAAEALLNVVIGALAIWIVTGQLFPTVVLTLLSVLRMYAIRRIFTRRNKV